MDNDQLISEIAYQIWEAEGRPAGRADAHWIEAKARLDAVPDESVTPMRTTTTTARTTRRVQKSQD